METIIKVAPSELNETLLAKIRSFIAGKENIDVTISLKEFDAEYADDLNRSIAESERPESMLSFTMEDFIAYTPTKPGK